MRTVLRGITVDNGGSEVRVLPYGAALNEMERMDSNFVEITEKDFRIKDVENPKHLMRVVRAPKSEYLGIVAQGLTGRAYNGTSLALNVQEAKTDSLNYYRQFIFAVAADAIEAYLSEAKITKVNKGIFKKVETYDNEEIMYKYVIVTCIPIREHSGNKDCANNLKSCLAGEYAVEFPLLESSPVVHFTIQQNYIGVTPEGGVAMNLIRNQIEKDDYSIVIDMGHITTDISIFKGKTLLGKVKTVYYAGNILVEEVKNALEEEGYRCSDEQTMRAIQTGSVRVGIHSEDVTKLLDECKSNFVNNYLKGEILKLLATNRIEAKQIQNAIFIGAAMNDTGLHSIQHKIIDACGFGNSAIIDTHCDSRYVNIKAASVFTGMLFKAAQEAESAPEV